MIVVVLTTYHHADDRLAATSQPRSTEALGLFRPMLA